MPYLDRRGKSRSRPQVIRRPPEDVARDLFGNARIVRPIATRFRYATIRENEQRHTVPIHQDIGRSEAILRFVACHLCVLGVM